MRYVWLLLTLLVVSPAYGQVPQPPSTPADFALKLEELVGQVSNGVAQLGQAVNTYQRQVIDLQKQVDDMKKQIDDLKKAVPTPPLPRSGPPKK